MSQWIGKRAHDPHARVTSLTRVTQIAWRDEADRANLKPASEVGTEPFELASVIRQGNRYANRKNVEGLYARPATQELVWFESLTEYHSLLFLDRNFDIRSIASQPMCILFADRTRHYPDFFALHKSGQRHLYDVKPLDRIDDRAREQFRKTAELCKTLGWNYTLRHGLDGVELLNLRYLAQFRQPWCEPDDETAERVIDFVRDAPATIDHVARSANFRHPELGYSAVHNLLWNRRIYMDERRPLSPNTLITPEPTNA